MRQTCNVTSLTGSSKTVDLHDPVPGVRIIMHEDGTDLGRVLHQLLPEPDASKERCNQSWGARPTWKLLNQRQVRFANSAVAYA